jgi:hypothetical protein
VQSVEKQKPVSAHKLVPASFVLAVDVSFVGFGNFQQKFSFAWCGARNPDEDVLAVESAQRFFDLVVGHVLEYIQRDHQGNARVQAEGGRNND